MMHPGIGGFMRQDSAGYRESMNLYEYCASNPSLFTDITGDSIWGKVEDVLYKSAERYTALNPLFWPIHYYAYTVSSRENQLALAANAVGDDDIAAYHMGQSLSALSKAQWYATIIGGLATGPLLPTAGFAGVAAIGIESVTWGALAAAGMSYAANDDAAAIARKAAWGGVEGGVMALATMGILYAGSHVIGAAMGRGLRASSKSSVIELELDAAKGGTETFYRTMSPANYKTLRATGKLPATSETFISPSLQYVRKFDGVTVQFSVRAGTRDALMKIGVRNSAKGFEGTVYEGLPILGKAWKASNKSWKLNNAFFKFEDDVINIGLGKGSALNIFNNGILKFNLVP